MKASNYITAISEYRLLYLIYLLIMSSYIVIAGFNGAYQQTLMLIVLSYAGFVFVKIAKNYKQSDENIKYVVAAKYKEMLEISKNRQRIEAIAVSDPELYKEIINYDVESSALNIAIFMFFIGVLASVFV
jgi:hypothetical protein